MMEIAIVCCSLLDEYRSGRNHLGAVEQRPVSTFQRRRNVLLDVRRDMGQTKNATATIFVILNDQMMENGI